MVRGKKHPAEQIVNLLRQVEVGVANEKSMARGAWCSGGPPKSFGHCLACAIRV
jgi:hypothetical protein